MLRERRRWQLVPGCRAELPVLSVQLRFQLGQDVPSGGGGGHLLRHRVPPAGVLRDVLHPRQQEQFRAVQDRGVPVHALRPHVVRVGAADPDLQVPHGRLPLPVLYQHRHQHPQADHLRAGGDHRDGVPALLRGAVRQLGPQLLPDPLPILSLHHHLLRPGFLGQHLGGFKRQAGCLVHLRRDDSHRHLRHLQSGLAVLVLPFAARGENRIVARANGLVALRDGPSGEGVRRQVHGGAARLL
mmetsp:Transcript_2716/g.4564  ORF Transcript_2716/g.4564 Transcript_2716/m.4564 type:complete len:242 (-) Transcript_2716:576-1301(-)